MKIKLRTFAYVAKELLYLLLEIFVHQSIFDLNFLGTIVLYLSMILRTVRQPTHLPTQAVLSVLAYEAMTQM